MNVLLIGASGTIGSAIYNRLSQKDEVVTAGRNSGDVQVDIESPESISAMYNQVGKVDAVISATGNAIFLPLEKLTPAENAKTITSKLSGQVNLVLLGIEYLQDGGSFTLTSGIMMEDPIAQGASAAMANGAITAFVKSLLPLKCHGDCELIQCVLMYFKSRGKTLDHFSKGLNL